MTVIVTVLAPDSRSVLPDTTKVANGSVVTGTTVTALVPNGTSIESPAETSWPATLTESNVLSLF